MGVKIQLNLFYECEGFSLSQMPSHYRTQFSECSDWLRLSFHSKREYPKNPYATSVYGEVRNDCEDVHREILRFAGSASLASTTTLHYVCAAEDGVRALHDCGMQGLLGLYGTEEAPRDSYTVSKESAARLRHGIPQREGNLWHFPISCILNLTKMDEITSALDACVAHPFVGLMIHEQYFYEDYPRYQADFEQKVTLAVKRLCEDGRISCFAQELCEDKNLWS